jgi:hypothetical protein
VIAKVPSKRKDGKSSFRDLIDYICGKDGERAVHVGFQGISSAESAALEMETVKHCEVKKLKQKFGRIDIMCGGFPYQIQFMEVQKC